MNRTKTMLVAAATVALLLLGVATKGDVGPEWLWKKTIGPYTLKPMENYFFPAHVQRGHAYVFVGTAPNCGMVCCLRRDLGSDDKNVHSRCVSTPDPDAKADDCKGTFLPQEDGDFVLTANLMCDKNTMAGIAHGQRK